MKDVLKAGAPSKYDPAMCDKVIATAAQGGHIAEMMLSIGIKSKDTWYRWQKEHPEFAEAVKDASTVSLAFHERNLLQGALGMIPGFNATAYAMIMNNKFKAEYSRSGSGGTEITVNNLNLTDEQMLQKIQQKYKRLKSLGIDFEEGQIIDVQND